MKKATKKGLRGTQEKDELGFWGGFWSFVFPPVGVFKYAMNKDTKPQKAKTALTVAVASVALSTVGYLVNKEK